MTQIICDTPESYDDGPCPLARAWLPADQLTPTPPKGWIRMLDLGPTPAALEIGCWLCGLWLLEREEIRLAEARLAKDPLDPRPGRKDRHVLARDPHGARILLVHPSLKTFARQTVQAFNDAIESCNCGGSDCLAGGHQYAALKVLARRSWLKLPIPQRINLLLENEYDEPRSIGLAIGDPAFLRGDDIDINFLEEITGAR